jgi:hypothetical protein
MSLGTTLTMWVPNLSRLSKSHRVCAIDVMGQPGKSMPSEPMRNAADHVEWSTAVLDALHLDTPHRKGALGLLGTQAVAAIPVTPAKEPGSGSKSSQHSVACSRLQVPGSHGPHLRVLCRRLSAGATTLCRRRTHPKGSGVKAH